MRLSDLLGTWARGRAERGRLRELEREVAALARAHAGLERDLAERVVHAALPPEAPPELLGAAEELVHDLLLGEGLFQVPDVDPDGPLTTAQMWQLTAALGEAKRAFQQRERIAALLEAAMAAFLEEILDRLPALPPSGGGVEALAFRTPLVSLLEDPAPAIEAVLGIAFAEELEQAGLLQGLSARLERNLLEASGIDPGRREKSTKRPVPPTRARDKAPHELVEAYLGGTPFEAFFLQPWPFRVPLSARFEHTHIVGGSGHGKTQLLQQLILHDLDHLKEGHGSLVVIDSQGDMIRKILALAELSPRQSLAERLVLIDPNDVEHPPRLNLFDFGLERLQRYGPAEREKLINGAIALYEYMFGALLGADLTQRQGVIFRYLARLLMVVPGATIHTLREFMETPEATRPHLPALDPTARHFFETQFYAGAFDDTRRQILTRLWGILSNTVLARMFAHPSNRVDLFEAINSGKLVLINTAKDLLKHDGCAILGRFFIAMIAQAAQERAVIPEDRRRATFLYVDEAQDYFDESIDHLLNQARKYKLGLVLAHQNLDQLDRPLLAAIMASTAIKIAGGVSAKDAAAFAREMRCEPEFLQGMRKRHGHTEFACWLRNLTPHPIRLTVPFGGIEGRPRMSPAELEDLLASNRSRYCAPIGEEAAAPRPPPDQAAGSGFEVGEHELL